MGPAGVMAQHLDIDEPHQKLLHASLVQLGVFKPGLEDLYFPHDYRILFCLALALPDSPDQGVEFLAP